jgi:hypothetical protein
VRQRRGKNEKNEKNENANREFPSKGSARAIHLNTERRARLKTTHISLHNMYDIGNLIRLQKEG